MASKIADVLAFLEQQMQLELQRVRAGLQHSGNKGTSLEHSVRSFLGRFLPPSVKIGHGEAIDSSGQTSGQLDVIVTNRHHPPMNLDGEPSMYFIEGIAAIGEVKACLRHADVDNAVASCAKFKSLKPHHPDGVQVYSNPEDLERYVDRRPYFLFAFDSEIKLINLQEKLTTLYRANGMPLTQQIDAVFLLGHGSVLNAGKGTGNLKVKFAEESRPGFHTIVPEITGVLCMLLGWYHLVTPEVEYRWSPMTKYILPSMPGSEGDTAR